MRKLAIALAFLGLMTLASPASAGFIGFTVEFKYFFPNTSAQIQGPTNAVVGAGLEFPNLIGLGTGDFTDTTITVDWAGLAAVNGLFTSAVFNGPQFFDVFAAIPSFMSVTINPATTFAAFTASRLFFDADTIRLNFESLQPTVGQSVVVLDVSFAGQANPVPEPATLSLFGLGAAAVFARRKRKATR